MTLLKFFAEGKLKAKAVAASRVKTSSASGGHSYSLWTIIAVTNSVYLYLFMHAEYRSPLRMDIAEMEKVLASEPSSK